MLVSQLCLTFGDPVVCPWDYPGRNTGVGCHFLLQGIFPTQGSNLHLLGRLHCRQIFFFFFFAAEPLGKLCLSPHPSQFHSNKNQPFWFSIIGKNLYLGTSYIWTILLGVLTILTLQLCLAFVAISSNCYFHRVKSCIHVGICWLISFKHHLLSFAPICEDLTHLSSVLYAFSLSNLPSFLFHLWKEYSWLSSYGSDMFSFKIDIF